MTLGITTARNSEIAVFLYKGNEFVVPALIADEDDEFNPEVNDAYRYAETKLFLAKNDDGKVVGRVAGLYHKAYNKKQNVKQLRFTRFDVIDDFAVTEALFAELKKWAIQGIYGYEKTDPKGYADLQFIALSYYQLLIITETSTVKIIFSRVGTNVKWVEINYNYTTPDGTIK
jgi:hypothetical protein